MYFYVLCVTNVLVRVRAFLNERHKNTACLWFNATQCSLNWISAMCVDTERSIKQIPPKSVRVDCVMPLPITTYFLLSRQKAAENSFFDLCCIPTDLASPAANLTVVDWLMTPPCLPESSWYISLWRRPSRALLGGTKSNIHCVQTLTVCAGR